MLASALLAATEEPMFVLFWAVFGLIVGVIAKLLMGHRPTSLVLTSLLGIAGALLGGFLGRALGAYPSYRSTGSFVASVFGAMIILAVFGAISRARKSI